MSNRYSAAAYPAVLRVLSIMLLASAALIMAGCNEPGDSDGVSISMIPLTMDPPDVSLDLSCANVGIFTETCVLDDPANPFINTGIVEFDVNNEEAFNKFDLANEIPAGPAGVKSRFYFWATALARRQNGENQYFTALALHELFTAQKQILGVGDPIVREQAKEAYRSVWNNFFGSVVFFTCCGEFFPVPRDDTSFAIPINELVLERLLRANEFPDGNDPDYPAGYAPLIPDDPTGLDAGLIELETQEVIGEWGFNYQCTGTGAARLCFVSVNEG